MANITYDTLDWYGRDEDGAGVHDVIGARCDPYTNLLLKGAEYHYCCHSNLTRALAMERALSLDEGKPRPTRRFIEFFAEIDLLAALSARPGGLRHQSLRRHYQGLSAQDRSASAARERAGRLAVTTAKQLFSLAWNPVKRRPQQIGGSFKPKSPPPRVKQGIPSVIKARASSFTNGNRGWLSSLLVRANRKCSRGIKKGPAGGHAS
jgi:Domain of unknown function (DUF1989)